MGMTPVDSDRGQMMRKLVKRMTKDMMADMLVKCAVYRYDDVIESCWEMLFDRNKKEFGRLMAEGDMDRAASVGLSGIALVEFVERSLRRSKKVDSLMKDFDMMMDERYPRRTPC